MENLLDLCQSYLRSSFLRAEYCTTTMLFIAAHHNGKDIFQLCMSSKHFLQAKAPEKTVAPVRARGVERTHLDGQVCGACATQA